jgi:DNA-binding CsgD family transcriptional regulator
MSSVRALAPTMIGRQAQIRELEEYLEQTRASAGRLVFVVGDAGVGKTRLLREFAGRVQADGVTLLSGHCYDEQPAPPYGPFVDALRALVRQRGPDAVAQVAGAWASSLAALLPELELPSSAPQPTGDPQSEKRRLFEAIYRVSRAIAQRGLVLVLEDLHWSDQSSQELLAYLARAVERDPILILATYRGDELHRRHPLTHLVAQLTRERRYHEVRVAALSREELASMLEATLERALPRALVDALYDRTEGNPFFVEEILKALIENARLDALIAAARRGHHSAQLDIPLSLKENILGRTTDFDSTTAEVLNYAAVIGRRFDFELLHKLTGLTEAELLRSIARLIERQLVLEERTAEDCFSFRHALTREAIYDDLLGRERRIKHRAVLHALDELYPENREAIADQLAYHSLQAKELAQAGRYARLAGDQAMRRRGYREALVYYETALELLETDDLRERATLTERLAEAASPLTEERLCLRYLREAHQLYQQIGDRRKLAEIDHWIGVAALWIGDMETAFMYTRAAVDALEAEPPGRDLATAYFMLSRLYMLSDRPQESIAWAEKAQPLAEAFADEELSTNLLNNIGCSLTMIGETQRGLSLLERAFDWAKRLGTATWFTRMRTYLNLSVLLSVLGKFARAADIAREGIERADEVGYIPAGEWLYLGIAELSLGHWDAAGELIDRVISHQDSHTDYVQSIGVKAELLLRRGRPEEARQLLEYGLPQINTLSAFLGRSDLWGALARTHLALGDIDQAVAIMDRGIADWRTIGPLLGTETLLDCGVEVYLAAGRVEPARELLDALATIAGRADSQLSLAHYDGARGLVAGHEGHHAEAAEHFRQAAARWQAMEAPFEEAVARRRLAESLLLTGDAAAREEARRELGMARAVFARLGAPLELAAADTLAEKYVLASQPAKGPTRKGELTARERQVIALIAQGYSNRQIAEALTISEKTAEIHVGNILGKLGLTSRAQAAAYAVQHGLVAAARGMPSS